jgi:hypothetical protein
VSGKMARPRSLVPQLHSPLFDSGVKAQAGVRGVQEVTQDVIYRGGGRQREGARKEEKKRHLNTFFQKKNFLNHEAL